MTIKQHFLTITLALMMLTNTSVADVYKCGTHYQSSPCLDNPDSKPTAIKQIDPVQREKSLAVLKEIEEKKKAQQHNERVKEQERKAYQDAYFNALSREIVERERQAVMNSLLPRNERVIMQEIEHMQRLQGKR